MDLYIFKTWLKARFANTERGASVIEYILILALIAILVIGVVTALARPNATSWSSRQSG